MPNKKLLISADAGLVPSKNFEAVLYTGNETSQNIAVNFQPDLIWMKNRDIVANHVAVDAVRTGSPRPYVLPNTTDAEGSSTSNDVNPISTGFSLSGGGTGTNNNTNDYVAWCWKAGGSSNTFNKNGTGYSTASAAGLTGESNVTIQGSSVNTETGISIITTLAGSAAAGETIPHGLGTQPELIISKPLNAVLGWYTWTPVINNGSTSSYTGWDFLFLNTDAAAASSAFVYASNTHIYDDWASGRLMVYYSFVSVAGYSKIGSYSGSNSPLTIYTTDDGTSGGANGFEPAFVMLKRTNASGSWIILDNKRTTSNGDVLFPDLDWAESSSWNTAFNSNGFTISSNEAWISEAGGEYIFMAFSA